MRVSDLINFEPVSIHVTTPVEEASRLMRETRLAHLAVTDHNGVRGLIGSRDILLASRHRARATADACANPRESIVRYYMAETVFSVGHCAKLLQAVDIMMSQHLSALPVTYPDGRVGTISSLEILHCFKAFCAMNPSHPVVTAPLSQSMTPKVITVDVQEKLGAIVALMIKEKIAHLPVLENGALAGIITDHDLRRAVGITCRDTDSPRMPMRSTEAELRAAEIMTSNPVALGGNDPIFDAASLMASKKIGAIPVVDVEARVSGILTITNILAMVRKVLHQAARVETGRKPAEQIGVSRSARILSSAGHKSPGHAGRTSEDEAR